jgi:hypothetical protein
MATGAATQPRARQRSQPQTHGRIKGAGTWHWQCVAAAGCKVTDTLGLRRSEARKVAPLGSGGSGGANLFFRSTCKFSTPHAGFMAGARKSKSFRVMVAEGPCQPVERRTAWCERTVGESGLPLKRTTKHSLMSVSTVSRLLERQESPTRAREDRAPHSLLFRAPGGARSSNVGPSYGVRIGRTQILRTCQGQHVDDKVFDEVAGRAPCFLAEAMEPQRCRG